LQREHTQLLTRDMFAEHKRSIYLDVYDSYEQMKQ
jgi:hypothetical protein